jgi:hypothetical protein
MAFRFNPISGTLDIVGTSTPAPTSDDQIVTHEYGLSGHIMYAYDPCMSIYIPIGPSVVIDNDGNVVWF